jgi:hypothetical protein
MIAQTNKIDFNLIKFATLTSALLLVNYFLWHIGISSAAQFTPLLVLIVVCFLFGKKTLSENWPVILFMISLAFITLGSPTKDWDARSFWLFHAKRMFLDNNFYAQLDGYFPIHNDYPLFVPALTASLGKLVGHWNEVFPKLSSILSLIPPIFFLNSILRTKIQQLLLCVFLLFVLGITLVNGYMDGILSVYFVSASLLIYILTANNELLNPKQRLWLYFLAANIFTTLTLIKNEGLVLFIILLCSAIFTKIVLKVTKIPMTMIVVAVFSLLPIIVWQYICGKNGVKNDLTQSDLTTQLTMRVYVVNNHIEILTSLIMRAQLLVPLVWFIFVSRKVNNSRCILFITFSISAYICVLWMIYLSTPYDLYWHLVNSTDRTILPIAFMLGFYALTLTDVSRLNSRNDNAKEG